MHTSFGRILLVIGRISSFLSDIFRVDSQFCVSVYPQSLIGKEDTNSFYNQTRDREERMNFNIF